MLVAYLEQSHTKKRFIQSFATQQLGKMHLKQGRQRITIRALNKLSDQVCDLKCVSLMKSEVRAVPQNKQTVTGEE